jgi:hypothetical protein
VKVQQDIINTSARLRKYVRRMCDQVGTAYPIEVVEGYSEPTVKGRSWHYENASGDLISFPNAYRRAWGKPIYTASTRRIEVGADWLRIHAEFA